MPIPGDPSLDRRFNPAEEQPSPHELSSIPLPSPKPTSVPKQPEPCLDESEEAYVKSLIEESINSE